MVLQQIKEMKLVTPKQSTIKDFQQEIIGTVRINGEPCMIPCITEEQLSVRVINLRVEVVLPLVVRMEIGEITLLSLDLKISLIRKVIIPIWEEVIINYLEKTDMLVAVVIMEQETI
jgi:hypothetical protein